LRSLSAATLELAPLRERPGDILPLARHFLEVYRLRLDLGPTELGAEAAQRLLEHSWPGNIRELENAMHHALLLCHGSHITPEDLRLSAFDSRAARSAAGGDEERTSFEQALLELFDQGVPNLFEYIENLVLKTAYHHCSRNQLQTARLLGISRNVVRARLIRFGEITGSLRGTRNTHENRAPEAREITG
jgi:sigma-54 dependent transcriptional regulator